MTIGALRADPAEIRKALEALFERDDVAELRALDVRDGRRGVTLSGYFNDFGLLAMEASRLSDAGATGVYVTLNPVNPALLARSVNRVRIAKSGEATGDRDIVRRRWLLIDLDPERPSGISSSDGEKRAAFALARDVYKCLRSEGWPDPIAADSGNGYHLLYRVDLAPADGELVKHVLEALDFRFGGSGVKIDTSVFNPARIVKLYGTVSRKGDSTPERPHRISRIIKVQP
jgi:hypothetical protein